MRESIVGTSVNVENFVINAFGVKSHYIGDDAALIGRSLYSQDAFFENVHFKRTWMSLYQVGYKAMIINISDAVAMNALPLYALVTLALPKDLLTSQIAELIKGLHDAAKAYNCEIVGGDTIANIKIDISITIVAQSSRPLLRNGFRMGDILAYTGRLGESKKGLKKLFKGFKLSSKARFIRPTLRQDFVKRSQRILNAGMDISDGLFEDAKKMTKMKNTSFRSFVKLDKDLVCSGEEYEMLVSFPPKAIKAVKRRAQQTRTTITPFARVSRASKNKSCKANHF